MIASSNEKKKFVVIAVLDEKDPANIYTILSEDHDAACHQMEISFGEGAFMALDKKQAQKVYKKLNRYLQNW